MPSRNSILPLAVLVGFAFTGCPSPSSKPTTSNPPAAKPLRLLVIDDPGLGKAVAREWQARTEESLEVRDVTHQEIAAASRLPGDVVVFPSGLIGELAERGLISPLDDALLMEPDFSGRDIFDELRLREMTWGNRTVAVPLGSPRFLFAYRADIFERLNLKPPANWAEYQQLVEQLSDRSVFGDLAPPEGQPWRATVEPLADGWAGQLLLARAAAYAMHRDQISPLFDYDSAKPLIDGPPYERALTELVAAANAGGFADQRLKPKDAMNELISGRSAMALAWPAPAPGERAESPTAQHKTIRFALLPGARQAFLSATKRWEDRREDDQISVPVTAISGRLAAVTSNAASAKRAEGFVAWLAGSEVSSQVGPQSLETTIFRHTQIADAARWTGGLDAAESKQYAETLAESMSLPLAFPGMRLPGRARYLEALDKAVMEAVAGTVSPAEALAKAAARWSEINASIGVEKQQKANRRSLGHASLP